MATQTMPAVLAEAVPTELPPGLDKLFRPRSIAVIGASRTPGTIGWMILDNLLRHGFTGAVYPVNPRAKSVHSVPAYPSVEAIPEEIDLAVVAVPKGDVIGVAEACGKKGVGVMIVISAGFKEVGPAGLERERELMEVVRRYGMRLVGPNCLGVLTSVDDVRMDATFAPAMPPPGNVAFMSQSGALGLTILDYAAEFGIGVHNFVSVGNKADVSGNDLIRYWVEDPGVAVILMYLESFGNPRKFTRIARSVTKKKPILVVKSGRTAAGARAASSHTGSLAGADTATEALLAQCGVIRCDTIEALFDLSLAFSHLPIPKDNSVAIITNAGGPGIIIADSCESAGLRVVELSADTQARLRRDLPEEASVRNPVDMIATATPHNYRLALDAVLEDPNVSAAIAAFVPPLGVRQLDVAMSIIEAVEKNRSKPVLAVLMGRDGLPEGRQELSEANIPAYMFPESAAHALAAMNRYRQWLERPDGVVHRFEVDDETARRVLDNEDGWLSTPDTMALLEAYGVPVVPARFAASADEAVRAARDIGLPVVMKVAAEGIVHKSDVGGVALDLRTEQEVRAAFESIMKRAGEVAGAVVRGVDVQKMVKGGHETIIGMTLDRAFGPILMFGLGGIYVEALGDVVFRIQPVSDIDAREMVDSIRGAKLLAGMRGDAPADKALLAEVIQRISQMVGDHPRIVELDINPLVVFEEGGMAVDARIRLAGGPV